MRLRGLAVVLAGTLARVVSVIRAYSAERDAIHQMWPRKLEIQLN